MLDPTWSLRAGIQSPKGRNRNAVEHVDGNETRRSLFYFASPSVIWKLIPHSHRVCYLHMAPVTILVGAVERICPGDVSMFFEIRIDTNAHIYDAHSPSACAVVLHGSHFYAMVGTVLCTAILSKAGSYGGTTWLFFY
jgi:hypothetical protein